MPAEVFVFEHLLAYYQTQFHYQASTAAPKARKTNSLLPQARAEPQA